MNKLLFYPRLAAQGIRKNGRYYLPYLLTCVFSAALFYNLFFLTDNEGINRLQGAAYVTSMMGLGTVVVGLFSTVLLFYTNSFLIRRRKRELGLYRVLGMEKRHIARVLLWETWFTTLITLAGGLGLGVLLSKLMLLLLCRILETDVPFGFFLSVKGLLWTGLVFCAILFLCLLSNLRRMGKQKLTELLYSEQSGDREPKSRWLAAVLGLLTLGSGYAMAVSVQDALEALLLFFVAVLLVIVGTYFLFLFGSIGFLKLLRRNRRFYYQTNNFISVSGMLHRMKRNAAGLATVCILSTMVLVTVSTTVCLYQGSLDVVKMLYPRDVQFVLSGSDLESMEQMKAQGPALAAKLGLEISDQAWACFYPSEGEIGRQTLLGKNVKEYMAKDRPGLILRAEEHPNDGEKPEVYYGFNVPADVDTEALVAALEAEYSGLPFTELHFSAGYTQERQSMRAELLSALGGFLFIGLLLGFLFLMATALILYYKQVSEGYEDARGFRIMQQVGLSQQEVRGSIRKQILTVFFLPLLAAALHIAFAFPMISKLLELFSLNNVGLFALCTLGTFLCFALLYAAIYAVTARAYYKIVRVA